MFNPKLKPVLFAVISVLAVSSSVYAADDATKKAEAKKAEEKKADIKIEKVKVGGILPDRLESVPGSFNVIDEEELQVRRPFSVQEVLSNIPGVNVVGENSFGLGLNIGLRGLNPRRTSRTLLMEDGVPIFLGAYGDPAAHYTTMIDRVQRVEVVKGSGQILYGPQTIGGMINFVTKPVPKNGFEGHVQAGAGNNNFTDLNASLGYGGERGGILVDATQKKGDGIRKNHDFDVQDINIKGQLNLTERQTLIAKIGYYEEDSRVSETGLGAREYAEDKFQAPTGRNDRFQLERKSAQLTHLFQMSDTAKLTTNAYYSKIDRSSFRQINAPGFSNITGDDADIIGQGEVDFSAIEEADDGEVPTGRSGIERCPEGVNNANFANANACGGRHRPRSFTNYGFEPRLDFQHTLFGIKSDAVIGFRYNEESQQRRQFRDFDPRSQNLSFIKTRVLPREDLKIDVRAMSYYAQNTFYVGDWSFTPGIRLEDIHTNINILRADNDPQNSRINTKVTEALPGFGLTWNGLQNTTIFAGIHKGIAPPRPSRDLGNINDDPTLLPRTDPETSINSEIGFRTRYFEGVTFESTLFNTTINDIVIQDGGRFFNGGESRQAGLEMGGRIDFGTIFNTSHNFYIMGSNTSLFTAKFTKDNPGEDINSGNRLPYAPRQISSVNFGYQHPVGIDARIGFNYVGKQFVDGQNTRVGDLTGMEGTIPAFTLINASVNFRPTGSKASYFLSGFNLADREYLASRVDGMVVGRGRQVVAGVRYDF